MTSSTPAAAKKAPEQIIAKDIPELAENVVHVHASPVKATSSVVNGRMTITIVLCPFIVITQYFVSLSGFLEFFFGRFISRIAVGMKLHGHFTIGFFNFIRGSPCSST